MIFSDLCSEVARRATRDQSGTQFTQAIKNLVNTSLFRICRDGQWRQLRRTGTFQSVTSYTKGSGAVSVTANGTTVTVTGATLITDGIQIGRRVKISNDGTFHYIRSITSDTTFTIDSGYNGSNSTTETYEILPQCEYNLPIQTTQRCFLWHEAYGYPFLMTFITDLDFYRYGLYQTIKYIPTHYRMWGVNDVIAQPLQARAIKVASSSSADTNIAITVTGVVSGYPDYEVITTDPSNGTTAVTGSKLFTSIDTVSRGSSSVGRVTVSTATDGTVVAVLPVGDTTNELKYHKVQLYPLPNTVFTMNVWFYKQPMAMVNDDDVHDLGQDFDEAIILLATSKLKAETNMAEGDKFYLLWQDEMRSLRRTNMDKMDFFPTLRRPGGNNGDLFVTSGMMYRQAGPMFGPSSRM